MFLNVFIIFKEIIIRRVDPVCMHCYKDMQDHLNLGSSPGLYPVGDNRNKASKFKKKS